MIVYGAASEHLQPPTLISPMHSPAQRMRPRSAPLLLTCCLLALLVQHAAAQAESLPVCTNVQPECPTTRPPPSPWWSKGGATPGAAAAGALASATAAITEFPLKVAAWAQEQLAQLHAVKQGLFDFDLQRVLPRPGQRAAVTSPAQQAVAIASVNNLLSGGGGGARRLQALPKVSTALGTHSQVQQPALPRQPSLHAAHAPQQPSWNRRALLQSPLPRPAPAPLPVPLPYGWSRSLIYVTSPRWLSLCAEQLEFG